MSIALPGRKGVRQAAGRELRKQIKYKQSKSFSPCQRDKGDESLLGAPVPRWRENSSPGKAGDSGLRALPVLTGQGRSRQAAASIHTPAMGKAPGFMCTIAKVPVGTGTDPRAQHPCGSLLVLPRLQGGTEGRSQPGSAFPVQKGGSAFTEEERRRKGKGKEGTGRRGRGRSIQGVRFPFTCPYGWLHRHAMRQSGRVSSSQGRPLSPLAVIFQGCRLTGAKQPIPAPSSLPRRGRLHHFALRNK